MAAKNSPPTSKEKQTVASIIGDFTEEQINIITDNAVKETALEALNMATGIAKVILEPEDKNQEMIAASLQQRNVTLSDAEQIAADGQMLIDMYKDRVAKEAASRAAGNKLEASRGHLHAEVQSSANILRGVLGAKSTALETFGVKMLGGRGGGRKKSASDKDKNKKGGGGGGGGASGGGGSAGGGSGGGAGGSGDGSTT